MKRKTEGWLEVVAAVAVLYTSLLDPAVSAALAGVILLVMGVWRLYHSR